MAVNSKRYIEEFGPITDGFQLLMAAQQKEKQEEQQEEQQRKKQQQKEGYVDIYRDAEYFE